MSAARWNLRRVAAASCAAALLLAGCGDDGDADAAASDPSTTMAEPPATTAAPKPAISAGCGTAGTPGEATRTLTSGGLERQFILHLPPGVATDPDQPRPLVLDLHGYVEGMVIHATVSQMATIADREDAVVVFPSGTGDPVFWNATEAPDVVDDLSFLGELLDTIEAETCIDTERVYAMGLSNGAFMSSRLACRMSDRIAAVGVVAGVMVWDDCTPDRPVPVLAIHGDADGIVSFDGAVGEGSATLPINDTSAAVFTRLNLQPVPEAVAAWAERNGCEGDPTEERMADDTVRITHPCDEGASTELIVVEEGGHSWPGSAFMQGASGIVGRTTMSFSASEEIWEFFEEHRLNGDS